MIRRRVSAALLALDGFTGEPLGARVMCTLDGAPLKRPVWKRDGWLAVADLPPGEHRLTLRCPGYQEQTVVLSGEAWYEGTVLLQPGVGYAWPRGTVFQTLSVTGPAGAEGRLFVGTPDPRPLKLAREAKEGESSLNLLLRGSLPRPGWFLFNGKAVEAAFFRQVTADGIADTASPLARTHPRGDTLVPVRCLSVRAGETVHLPFRYAESFVLFCGETLKKYKWDAEARLEWKLEA